MRLINSCFGSFGDRKQIRMAFFSSLRGLLAVSSGATARSRERPPSMKGWFLRMNEWPTDAKVRVALPLEISAGWHVFPQR